MKKGNKLLVFILSIMFAFSVVTFISFNNIKGAKADAYATYEINGSWLQCEESDIDWFTDTVTTNSSYKYTLVSEFNGCTVNDMYATKGFPLNFDPSDASKTEFTVMDVDSTTRITLVLQADQDKTFASGEFRETIYFEIKQRTGVDCPSFGGTDWEHSTADDQEGMFHAVYDGNKHYITGNVNDFDGAVNLRFGEISTEIYRDTLKDLDLTEYSNLYVQDFSDGVPTVLYFEINDPYNYKFKGTEIKNNADTDFYQQYYVDLVEYEVADGWTSYDDDKYYIAYQEGKSHDILKDNDNYEVKDKNGNPVTDVKDKGIYTVTLTQTEGLYWARYNIEDSTLYFVTDFSANSNDLKPLTLTFAVVDVQEVDDPVVKDVYDYDTEKGFWFKQSTGYSFNQYYDKKEHEIFDASILTSDVYTVEVDGEAATAADLKIKDVTGVFGKVFDFTLNGLDESKLIIYKWKNAGKSTYVTNTELRYTFDYYKHAVYAPYINYTFPNPVQDGNVYTSTKEYDGTVRKGYIIDDRLYYYDGTKIYNAKVTYTDLGGNETVWYDNTGAEVIDNTNDANYNVVFHAGTYSYKLSLVDTNAKWDYQSNTVELVIKITQKDPIEVIFNKKNVTFIDYDTPIYTSFYDIGREQGSVPFKQYKILTQDKDGNFTKEVNYVKYVGKYRVVYKVDAEYFYDGNYVAKEKVNGEVTGSFNISEDNCVRNYNNEKNTFYYEIEVERKALNVVGDFKSNLSEYYTAKDTKIRFVYNAEQHELLRLDYEDHYYDNMDYIIQKKDKDGNWNNLSSFRYGVKDPGEYRIKYSVKDPSSYKFDINKLYLGDFSKELFNVSEDGNNLYVYVDVAKFAVGASDVMLTAGSSFTYNGKKVNTVPAFGLNNTIIEVPYIITMKNDKDIYEEVDQILDAGEYKITVAKIDSDAYPYTYAGTTFNVIVDKAYVEVTYKASLEYGDTYATFLKKLTKKLDNYNLSNEDLEEIYNHKFGILKANVNKKLYTEKDLIAEKDLPTTYLGYYPIVFETKFEEEIVYDYYYETKNYDVSLSYDSEVEILKKYLDIIWTYDNFTYTGKSQAGSVKAYYINNLGTKTYLSVSNTNNNAFKNADEYRYTAVFNTALDTEEIKQSDVYVLPAINTKEYTIKKATINWDKVVFDNYKIEYDDYLKGLNEKVDYEAEVAMVGLNSEIAIKYDLSNVRPYLGKYTITATLSSDNYEIPSDKKVWSAYFIVGVKSQTINKKYEEEKDEIATIEAVGDNVLDPTLFLVVEIIEEEFVEEKVLKEEIKEQEKLSWTDQVISVYDVSLIDENNIKQQPDGTLRVALKIPEEIKGGNYRIYHRHVDANGNVEITLVDIDQEVNGYAVFTTDKLSEFVFVYKYTSLLWLIIILSVLIAGALFLIGYQLYKYIDKNGFSALFKKKNTVKTLAAAPVFFMAGHVPAVVTLSIILFALLVINLLLYLYLNGKFDKKAQLQEGVQTATPVASAVSAPVVAAPVMAAPIYVVAPAVEDEGKSLSESMETLETVVSNGSINKKTIADYLVTDEFKGKTEVNRRANYTAPAKGRDIGLPLADTHYVMVNGKRVCFTYVYENNNGSILMLLKTSSQHIEMLKKQHSNIVVSKFPKTTQALKWYSLPIDESYSDQQVFELLREAMKAIEDSSYVAIANSQDAWIVEQQEYLKKNTITVEEDANGLDVIGVFFEHRQQKLYFFKYEGIEYSVGEVATYRAIEGDDRKVVVAIPRIKRSESKLHFPVKSLNKIQ